MARPQQNVSVPFPVRGLADLSAYENQPKLTTPLARNVRAFAFTGDSSDESKRGRMTGGQRAGMALYHPDLDRKFSVGDITDCPIQDINHISGRDLDPIVGTDHMFLNKATGTGSTNNLQTWKSATILDVSSIGNGFTVLATAYGRSNVGWAVIRRDTSNNVDLIRLERDLTQTTPPWKYTAGGSNTLTLSSAASATCHGVVAYGDYVFAWIRTPDAVDPDISTEDVYKVKAGATLTEVKEGGWDGGISNADGSTVGSTGWAVVGSDVGDTLIAVGGGTIGMLSVSGNNVKLYQKSVVTGENTTVANMSGDTGPGSVYGVVADKRGDFWVACNVKGDSKRKTGLFKVSRGATSFTETKLTSEYTGGGLSALSTDTESADWAPRSVDYDHKNDRVFVVGKDRVCGMPTGRSMGVAHANELTLKFMSKHVDSGNERFEGFRDLPLNEGDAITLKVNDPDSKGTGNGPAGLTDESEYFVRDISTDIETGLYRFRVSSSRGDPALSLSATATGTELFKFVRAAGERVYVDNGTVGKVVELRPANLAPDVEWGSVRVATNGGAIVTQAEATDTLVSLSPDNILDASQTLGSRYDVDATVDSPFRKMGRNAVENIDPSGRVSSRSFVTLVTAMGTVKKLTSGGFGSIKNSDYKMRTDAPVIFSAAYGDRVYYVDGINGVYYDSSYQDGGEEGEIVDWDVDRYDNLDIQGEEGGKGITNRTDGAGKGSFPKDPSGNKPTLITTWGSRLVLSGLSGEPQNWFMSRSHDPNDFDFLVRPQDDQMAATGSQSPAGLVPDKVNALVPYNDDILIFGCDHSIYQLSGDPAMGGVIDLLTDVTGMVWGRGWCKDPSGVLYFFGSRGGVFKMVPGSPPQSITSTSISERLAKIDLSKRVVRMLWNDREHGVNLFLSHSDPTEQVEHYFYDSRAGSWWEDRYEAKETGEDKYVHNATAYHVFDGDKESDREILVGGRNGAIYKISIKEQDDRISTALNKEIDSFVWLGPFSLPDGRKIVLTETTGLLAHDSGNVDYGVYVGPTAELIIDLANDALDTGSETTLNKNRRFDGTFAPDRKRASSGPVDRRRAIAHDIFIRLRNNTAAEDWALEGVILKVGSAGIRSSRGHEVGKNA